MAVTMEAGPLILGALFLLIVAVGGGMWGWLSDGDMDRAERREQALRDELLEARRTIAGLNADLVTAAGCITRHGIARRYAEARLETERRESEGLRTRLADCRCTWPAPGFDEPTLDLGDGDGLAAQVERFLAEREES